MYYQLFVRPLIFTVPKNHGGKKITHAFRLGIKCGGKHTTVFS